MNRKTSILFCVFTFILSNAIFSQIVWQETFDIAEKGVWGNENGETISDLSGIDWNIDFKNCEFSDEKDYAKTVSTSGGRFEVLDSDGEVVWYSPKISISGFDAVQVSFTANETGSGTNETSKYIDALIWIHNSNERIDTMVSYNGNWGAANFSGYNVIGDLMQLVIKMNSSYSSDKIYIDNILVEAIDSSVFDPSYIKIVESPAIAFVGEPARVSAGIYNKMDELLVDSSLKLKISASDLDVEENPEVDGIYSWNLTSASDGEFDYSIVIEGSEITAIDSWLVFLKQENAVIIDGFENSTADGWQLDSDWIVSDEEPIAGQYSIKHNASQAEEPSVLVYDNIDLRLSEKKFLFSYKIKNGNWNPSSSNSFCFGIMSDDVGKNGYWFGVNADGSSDLFSVWRVENGEPSELLAETNFEWTENTSAQMDIVREAWGDWSVSVSDLNNGSSGKTEFKDDEFLTISELDLIFNFTSTRAGKLWFDDLLITGENASPFIAKAVPISATQIEVIFNEAVVLDNISFSNFSLKGKSGKKYNIKNIDKKSNTSVVMTAESLDEAAFIVGAYNLVDLEGKKTIESFYEFENVFKASEFDIVLTEVMADPNPIVQLPEAEYFEVYNNSDKFIQLEGWELLVRTTAVQLPAYVIAPGEYLTLCGVDFKADFEKYGAVLAFDKFPSLLNAGTVVSLSNADGLLIESITYSDEWYYNSDKDNGGYSIERIDINRFCGQSGNWIVSDSETGGTPGCENSVKANNPDNIAPELLAVDIVAYDSIKVIFSEAIDATGALDANNFSIGGLPIEQIAYTAGETEVRMLLNNDIRINQEYVLTVSSLKDECGNSMVDSEIPFSLVFLSEGDVLVNEVLFNPYTNCFDFVELYNNSGVTIDLIDLKLANRDDEGNLKSVYNVSDLHIRFSPGELFAFSKNTLNIKETYFVAREENLFQMEKFPAYNNDEGCVVVLNDSMEVVDEFFYNESMHANWLTTLDGVSLERLSFTAPTNNMSNWISASSLVGYATPTDSSSQKAVDTDGEVAVELEADVVSPNGDGYNDELVIRFHLDDGGYLVNIFVFDAIGREVRRLTNNDLIGNMNELTYDVRTENGDLLALGSYVVVTELIHFDKKKQVLKNAFMVTDRL